MKRILIATGLVAIAGGSTTALFVSSCDTACTLEARPSVVISFIEQGGSATASPVPAEEVWYTVTQPTGETETGRGQCMDDECTEWILGYEREGAYDIHATVCGQEYTARAVVELDEDGCHVVTQWIQVEVDASGCPAVVPPHDPPLGSPPPTECTLEARPSVTVDVVAELDGRIVPVAPDRTWYEWTGAKGRTFPGNCMNAECSRFIAGWEQEGGFRLHAEVCGRKSSTTVDVGRTEDACHVDTQEVELLMDTLGCAAPPTIEAPEISPCDRKAYPSAYVYVLQEGGDVWTPMYTNGLVYQHEGTRGRGWCVDGRTDGTCATYIVGWEQDGRFRVRTRACDQPVEATFSVERTEDGCHVVTEYVPLWVSTTGCISAVPPPPPPPPNPRRPI